MSGRWTAAEVAALRYFYPSYRTAFVAARIGRSVPAVGDKAQALGLRKLVSHPQRPERPSASLATEIAEARAEWGQHPPYEGWRRER